MYNTVTKELIKDVERWANESSVSVVMLHREFDYRVAVDVQRTNAKVLTNNFKVSSLLFIQYCFMVSKVLDVLSLV